MTFFFAILLGALQGATEFLPVSSSGHLMLAQHLLGIHKPGLFFEALLHVGSLVAVLIYYRADIFLILKDALQGLKMVFGAGSFAEKRARVWALEGVRIAVYVVVASIPTMLIGLSLNDLLDPGTEEPLIGPKSIAIALLFNGAMLYCYRWLTPASRGELGELSDAGAAGAAGDSGAVQAGAAQAGAAQAGAEEQGGKRSDSGLWGMSLWHALLIGVAQGIAVMPGVSRSGSTITAALLLGVYREDAARFSFLLSIPAIVGAFVLKLGDLDLGALGATDWGAYVTGAVVAGLVGWFCLSWLVHLLRATKFYTFAYYCWIVGIVALVLLVV